MSIFTHQEQIENFHSVVLSFAFENYNELKTYSQDIKSKLNNHLQSKTKISGVYKKIFKLEEVFQNANPNMYLNSLTVTYLRGTEHEVSSTQLAPQIKEAEKRCVCEILMKIVGMNDDDNNNSSNSNNNNNNNNVKKMNNDDHNYNRNPDPNPALYLLEENPPILKEEIKTTSSQRQYQVNPTVPGVHLILPTKGSTIVSLCLELKLMTGFDFLDKDTFDFNSISRTSKGIICTELPILLHPWDVREYVHNRNRISWDKNSRKYKGCPFSFLLVMKKKDARDYIRYCDFLNGVEYE